MVSSEDELYDVGAFVQITEVHDMGDKIRMLIHGHRRWEHAFAHPLPPPPPPPPPPSFSVYDSTHHSMHFQ